MKAVPLDDRLDFSRPFKLGSKFRLPECANYVRSLYLILNIQPFFRFARMKYLSTKRIYRTEESLLLIYLYLIPGQLLQCFAVFNW